MKSELECYIDQGGVQVLEDYNVSIPTGKIGVKFDSALGILRTKDTEVFRQFLDREWMDTSRILSREMEFAKRAVMLVDPKGQFFTWLAGRLSHEAKYKLNTANG